jgi:NADP-dependent 3-hydroxy acid dehydrogenase YdfG
LNRHFPGGQPIRSSERQRNRRLKHTATAAARLIGIAGAGARLAIHHAGTTEELSDAAAVVREIQPMAGEATAFGQDFTQVDAGQHLAAAVTAWAPIDILVLNASMELLQTLVPPIVARGFGRVVTR